MHKKQGKRLTKIKLTVFFDISIIKLSNEAGAKSSLKRR